MIIKYEENYCGKNCTKETPFLILDENICKENCSINDIINLKCILSYNLNDSGDIMLINTLKYFKNNDFPKDIIEKGENITFKEKNVTFTISKLSEETLYNDISCFNSLNISYNDIYYLLNISISLKDEGKSPTNLYEIYYPINDKSSLKRSDLNILDENCFLKTNISKCALYSIESIINDKCLSCEYDFDYYPLDEEVNNPFFKCYKSPEGYYLDIITKTYKKCYYKCKKCDTSGNEDNNNCIEYNDEYETENIITSENINSEIFTTNVNNIYNTNHISNSNILSNCDRNNTKFIEKKNIFV